jgi:hypothetical protein
VLLQAALNGDRTKADRPAVPVSVEELARDAAACGAAGAGDEVVAEVRRACGLPVGVSTGAWIEPELERRLALVRAWRAPDYA